MKVAVVHRSDTLVRNPSVAPSVPERVGYRDDSGVAALAGQYKRCTCIDLIRESLRARGATSNDLRGGEWSWTVRPLSSHYGTAKARR